MNHREQHRRRRSTPQWLGTQSQGAGSDHPVRTRAEDPASSDQAGGSVRGQHAEPGVAEKSSLETSQAEISLLIAALFTGGQEARGQTLIQR